MAGYIEVPFEKDPDTLAAEAFDYLAANLPGWVPHEGHLESWLIEALTRLVAEAREVASRVPAAIFRYFGQSILDIPAIDATPATAQSTWTMIDAQGYTVEAGTLVAFRVAGDTLIPFRVRDTVVVAPGSVSTAVNEVTLEAVEPGTAANNLGAGPMELVDALAYVDSVVATNPAGGVNGESDDAYLDRLAEELELLAPRPILPNDFAVLARRVPGVYRAQAINLYDPATGTFDNERMVTVAVVDEDGNALSQAIKDEVDAYLESRREVNFIIHVIDPAYVVVDVAFTVVALDGWDLNDVRDRAVAAVTETLDPGTWGGGDQSPPVWLNTASTVRYLEVASLLDRVEGVDYVQDLTLNGGTADVALAGVAALPQTGIIDGTAVHA